MRNRKNRGHISEDGGRRQENCLSSSTNHRGIDGWAVEEEEKC